MRCPLCYLGLLGRVLFTLGASVLIEGMLARLAMWILWSLWRATPLCPLVTPCWFTMAFIAFLIPFLMGMELWPAHLWVAFLPELFCWDLAVIRWYSSPPLPLPAFEVESPTLLEVLVALWWPVMAQGWCDQSLPLKETLKAWCFLVRAHMTASEI